MEAIRKWKDSIADWMFVYVSGDKEQHCVPPGAEPTLIFGEDGMYTATTYNNDGSELWLAYTGWKWMAHYRAAEARQLAWFILWDWWAKATWFGLKRRLWYWALDMRCARSATN